MNGHLASYTFRNYGARYYHPAISHRLSVDPLAEKYPSLSPYTYTYDNPIVFVDPTGMAGMKNDGDYYGINGKYLGNDGIDDGKIYIVKGKATKTDEGLIDKEKTNAVEIPAGYVGLREMITIMEYAKRYGDSEFSSTISYYKNKIIFRDRAKVIDENNHLLPSSLKIMSDPNNPESVATLHTHQLYGFYSEGERYFAPAKASKDYDVPVFKGAQLNIVGGHLRQPEFIFENNRYKPVKLNTLGFRFYDQNSQLILRIKYKAIKRIFNHYKKMYNLP